MADIRMANDRGVANIHAQVDFVSDNPPSDLRLSGTRRQGPPVVLETSHTAGANTRRPAGQVLGTTPTPNMRARPPPHNNGTCA